MPHKPQDTAADPTAKQEAQQLEAVHRRSCCYPRLTGRARCREDQLLDSIELTLEAYAAKWGAVRAAQGAQSSLQNFMLSLPPDRQPAFRAALTDATRRASEQVRSSVGTLVRLRLACQMTFGTLS